MRRIILAVILILAAGIGAYGQSSPADVVLLLDTSSGMSSSYERVNDYITGAFLSEFLRIGDTFHLIVFSGRQRLDLARRIQERGDVETIIGRMLLQYPIESGSDAGAAINFTEEYIAALPSRPKKIVMIGTGGPDINNLVGAARQRLGSRNATLDFVLVTPGQPLANLPSSGRTPAARPSAAQRPQTAQPQTPAPQTAAPSGQAAPPPRPAAGQPVSGQPAAGTTAPSSTAAQTPPPSSPQTAQPQTAQPQTSSPATAAPPPSPATPSGASSPTAPSSAGQTPAAGTAVSPSPQSPGPDTTGVSSLPQPSGAPEGLAAETRPSTTGDTGERTADTISETARDRPSSPAPVQQRQKSSGESWTSSLPVIIGIVILGLLALGLIIFFALRRLGSSPNRVMASVSAHNEKDDMAPFADHSKELASYAAGQNRQRSTPYADRPVKPDIVKPAVINPSGPLLLNLFVEDQNTAIGKRNIHSLKSGYSLTVGGGKSDFLVFLVPIPPNIGEIRRNGGQCSFIPRKPRYFPDLGSNELRDCIHKTIRIVSDKNYEIRFRFEMYEDPLIELNRVLMSVKVPG